MDVVPEAALPSNVVAGPNPAVLDAIGNARVGLALWWRELPAAAAADADRLLAGDTFEACAAGLPDEAVGSLMDAVAEAAPALRTDVLRLAHLFGQVARTSVVRLRLEHVTGRSCPKLHVDAVRLRLLCTYAGRGTEWQDRQGTVRRMPPGHVALLKGTRWLGCEALVPHRSPLVADLPAAARHRLLLVVDRPELN